MVCGKVTNLVEQLKLGWKAKKQGKEPKMRLKFCRRRAVFAARIKGTKGWHNYCPSCFLRMWLHADLSKKVKLL